MNIEFTTEKINEKLYEQLILFYIYEHYNYKDYPRLLAQDKWEIVIKKTSDYDSTYYSNDPRSEELDFSIPHGVTMREKIICDIMIFMVEQVIQESSLVLKYTTGLVKVEQKYLKEKYLG